MTEAEILDAIKICSRHRCETLTGRCCLFAVLLITTLNWLQGAFSAAERA